MPKETRYENYRVEVTPEMPWLADKHEQFYRATEEIAKSIKRHVDDVAHVVSIYDTAYVCSNCESPWTEDSEAYNGGCCDFDEANNPNPEPEGILTGAKKAG